MTEFYFSDYRDLHASNSNKTLTVAFTVRNLEHQTTDYRYALSTVSANNTEQAIASGSFVLGHDRSRKTSEHITLPAAEGRTAVKATLRYEGIAHGDRTPSVQVQSIHHWITIATPGGNREI